MNDVLENQLSMMQNVKGNYELNQTTLDTIPAVTLLHTEFNGYINNILNIAGPANADLTGFTVDKQNKREELTMAILKVSTGFSAWCYVENNHQKAERFDETKAMINAKRDNDVYVYGKDLHTSALPDVLNLADYGVVAADFTALDTLLDEYLNIIHAPKVQIKDRAAKLSQMTKEFDAANSLLKDRLDKVMKIFSVSQPMIYESYVNARAIDDTGASSPADYEGVLPPGAIVMVADIPYISSRSFRIKNNGGDFVHVCLSNDPNNFQGTILVVVGGGTNQWQSSTFNPDPSANYLLMQNVGPLPAAYEVRIEE